MAAFEAYKQQVVAACQQLVAKGYLMATGGNLSVRIPGHSAMAITPSNQDYLKMTPDEVCILGYDLNQQEGQLAPSVESNLHAAIYQVRPDINAVVHTHQVYASALAIMNTPIPALFDEQVRFLGRSVEVIPYAPSGTGLLKNTVARHIRNHHNAYIMKNHGALCFGHDLERAVHNVEILEKCALAYLLALCAERPVSKVPLLVREIAFAKLRKDQQKAEKGATVTGGE